MEKNKPTRPANTDPNKQVHSEFEHSEGNNFEVVREETPVKKKPGGDTDIDEPLNELSRDEEPVEKKEEEKEPPKMDAGEKGS